MLGKDERRSGKRLYVRHLRKKGKKKKERRGEERRGEERRGRGRGRGRRRGRGRGRERGRDKVIAACQTISKARAPCCLTVADPVLGPKQCLGGGVGLTAQLHCPPPVVAFQRVLWFFATCERQKNFDILGGKGEDRSFDFNLSGKLENLP
ncbi:hypothetical protein llap_6350 [Limosa lapponica baueri]|uniref:Uncharacterized protein n=1 Tax=Limosa lapponica baueri TaxID=1758121 RepID=A0A2I0UB94_LIMLA|nr:hypothetical protein llap_6350 [Limosa lapponica baueri]